MCVLSLVLASKKARHTPVPCLIFSIPRTQSSQCKQFFTPITCTFEKRTGTKNSNYCKSLDSQRCEASTTVTRSALPSSVPRRKPAVKSLLKTPCGPAVPAHPHLLRPSLYIRHPLHLLPRHPSSIPSSNTMPINGCTSGNASSRSWRYKT